MSPSTFAQDVRYAARTLRRSPGFAAVTVLILALGIGANTAIFSVVSTVLLKPLPLPDADRLMVLWEDFTADGAPPRTQATGADYVAWQARNRSFEGLAAFAPQTYNLTGIGDPERLEGVRTAANLFTLLRMAPLLGRTLVPADDAADAPPVVVISERLWRRRFGADPDIVGRTIHLSGVERTVVGVVPPYFQFPEQNATVWIPAQFSAEELESQTNYYLYVVGRLLPGVSREQARADMAAVAAALLAENPRHTARITVDALHDELAHEARPTLLILLGAVAAVLLIGCANVANLLLARAASRERELAVRKALGAAPARVLRQLFTESGVLAALGVVAGIGLSTASFGYLARLVPGTYPGGAAPALDWRVLAFTAALALVTVLLFGAAPALAAARTSLNDALKRSVGATAKPGGGRGRQALVVGEIALTVVLLTAATLLLRSYAAVLAVDPGFTPDRLLVADTELSPSKYADAPRRAAFYASVLERVSALPGVAAAGYVNFPPLTFKGGRMLVGVEGQPFPPAPRDIPRSVAADRFVTGDYFRALGVPLVEGRVFDSRDARQDAPLTVVINAALAHRFWPDQDALGKRIRFGAADAPWITVIGVTGNVRQMALDADAEPEMFFPAEQVGFAPFTWPKSLVVRTRGEPLALASAVRDAVWAVDRDQPVSSIRSMGEIFDADVAARNTQLTLIGAFAALALLLAAVGLYGVLAYAVAQRTAEIGLRMALGAERARVVRTVLGSALGVAVAGLALGTLGALGTGRLLRSFLFGVSATDWITLVTVAATILVVTLLASYVPARRAAAVDPMTALRNE